MKKNITKSLLLVVIVLLFAISFVSPSEAQKTPKPIVLKGTYGVIGHDVCVGHWTPQRGSYDVYFTKTSTLHGTATFNGDGTGTFDGYQVTISHPIYTPIPTTNVWPTNISPPLGSTTTTHVTSSITYTIDPVTRVMNRTVTPSGTFEPGSIVGGQDADGWKFDTDPYQLVGYVALDLGTILASTPPATTGDYTGTVTIYMPDPLNSGEWIVFGTQEETCQRTRVSTQIK